MLLVPANPTSQDKTKQVPRSKDNRVRMRLELFSGTVPLHAHHLISAPSNLDVSPVTLKILIDNLNFQGNHEFMFGRKKDLERVLGLLDRHPVVGIIGARQVGKTTLAITISEQQNAPVTRFDLEDPGDLARMQDPMLALKDLRGLVIIDEIQRLPDLFQILRVLADRPGEPARFLILGSASPDLLRQGSESLAGRIVYYELNGFSLEDAGSKDLNKLWLRGGFPCSFLAANEKSSDEWRQGFIRTFLERDLPQLGVGVSSITMRRFWTMVAHLHGQVWNASQIANTFGVSDPTVRKYLDQLSAALVVRQLLPWHENLKKRQVKSPKVFLRDPGILHALLNLPTLEDLESHPKAGLSWEGFLQQEVITQMGVRPDECYFWATHAGAELDLLIVHGRRRFGFEFKRTVSPRLTKSMRIAIEDLELDQLSVVHAGNETYPLGKCCHAVSSFRITKDIEPL